MGQMNIKDEKLIADAKALAALLGTTATDAMRQAVQEKLAQEQQDRDAERQRRYEAIMAISREAAGLFQPGTSSDHTDLYDDDGLPK